MKAQTSDAPTVRLPSLGRQEVCIPRQSGLGSHRAFLSWNFPWCELVLGRESL